MLVEDLLLNDVKGTQYSPAIPLGNANSAMFELWINSATNIDDPDGVEVFLEGSNDGLNWDDLGLATTGLTTGVMPVYAPFYDATTPLLITFSQVRLRFEIKVTATPAAALVSASIRPWRAS